MKQWTKTAFIAAPLLVIGSVYAFASSTGNVSFSVHPAQTTPSQQSAGSNTNINNSVTTTSNTNAASTNSTTATPANVQNPFLVPGLTDNDTTSNTQSSTSQQSMNTTNQVSLESIQHFNLHALTPQGLLQINYTLDGKGLPKLEGKTDGKNVHLSGDQAKQLMQAILNQFQLLPVLEKGANEGSAQVILPAGVQIQELQVQLDNKQTFHLRNQATKQDTNPQPSHGNENGKGHGKGHEKQKQHASPNGDDQGEDD